MRFRNFPKPYDRDKGMDNSGFLNAKSQFLCHRILSSAQIKKLYKQGQEMLKTNSLHFCGMLFERYFLQLKK